MPGSLTGVSTSDQDAARDRIDATIQFIIGQERVVEGCVDQLRAGWKGAAAKGFETVMLNWMTNMEDIRNTMVTLAENIGAGSTRQKALEAQLEQQARSQAQPTINQLHNLLGQ